MADGQEISDVAQRLGVNPSDPVVRRDLEALKPGAQPNPEPEPTEAGIIIWALALAFGVAGALAWQAPVAAFFWPLGLGGASLSLAAVGWSLNEKPPNWAILAVIAGGAAVALGVAGMLALEHARQVFE